eukprot:6264-Heterococcus_DN1.PRE.2
MHILYIAMLCTVLQWTYLVSRCSLRASASSAALFDRLYLLECWDCVSTASSSKHNTTVVKPSNLQRVRSVS